MCLIEEEKRHQNYQMSTGGNETAEDVIIPISLQCTGRIKFQQSASYMLKNWETKEELFDEFRRISFQKIKNRRINLQKIVDKPDG